MTLSVDAYFNMKIKWIYQYAVSSYIYHYIGFHYKPYTTGLLKYIFYVNPVNVIFLHDNDLKIRR